MYIDIKKAKDVFENYVKEYDPSDPKIALKIAHIQRVSQRAKEIAEELQLDEEDIELAELIGLLHDIGRFEQVRVYNTFMDKDSVNHAEYGIKVLFQNKVIRKFLETNKYDDIIKKAILNHNKGKNNIDKDLNDKELLHTKIIRDADKLDIFYVLLTEDINVLYGEDIEKQNINKEIYREFIEDKNIEYKNIKSGLDLLIAHFAYIYDFNFKYTLKQIEKNNYIEKLYNRIAPNTKEESKETLMEVYKYAKKYMNEIMGD